MCTQQKQSSSFNLDINLGITSSPGYLCLDVVGQHLRPELKQVVE